MGLILSLLCVLWGIYNWFYGCKWKYLISVCYLLTNGFGFKFLEMNLKYYDFFLILLVVPIVKLVVNRQSLLLSKNDRVGKIILVIEGFFLLSFVITVLLGIEEFSFAFKTYRNVWFLFIYFILIRIRHDDFKKAMELLFKISIILGIVFLLQIVGIELLSGGTEFDVSSGTVSRMRNIPMMSVWAILVVILAKMKINRKIILLIMWTGILVLSQHRGVMLSIIIALPFVMIMNGETKKIIKISVVFSVVVCLFMPLLIDRFSLKNSDSGLSMIEEIKKGLNFSKISSNDIENGQTFIFRSFLVKERCEYMWDRPINFLLGCGMMHEDSPSTQRRFKFTVGTKKIDSNGYYSIQQQISTSDVAFLSWFMRYGFLMLVLLGWLYSEMIRRYRHNNNLYGTIGFILLTYCLIRCMSGDEFTSFMYFLLFATLIYSIKTNELIEKKSCVEF